MPDASEIDNLETFIVLVDCPRRSVSLPNVHHLELFYFVAKHRGITNAVRKMPYGIGQPAVSGQMLQLERELGVRLFHRRPFALTPAGQSLYTFIAPFFSRLPEIAAELRGEADAHLRLAASEVLLAHHIPEVLAQLRKDAPDLRLTLQELPRGDLEASLASGDIDLAIVVLHGPLSPTTKVIELVRFPMVLLAPQGSKARSFAALCKPDPAAIAHPLVSLPPDNAVSRLFQDALEERGIRWDPRVEVSSLELVARYTELGYGYGLSVAAPGVATPPGLRRLRLPGFPPVRIGLLFHGRLKPIAERFARAANSAAKKLVR